MQSSNLESVAQATLINLIDGYKTYISPKKGFSCPHRLLHGGESCSDYVKRMLTQQRLISALQSSVHRFGDCTAASKTLSAANTNSAFGCIIIPCCLPF